MRAGSTWNGRPRVKVVRCGGGARPSASTSAAVAGKAAPGARGALPDEVAGGVGAAAGEGKSATAMDGFEAAAVGAFGDAAGAAAAGAAAAGDGLRREEAAVGTAAAGEVLDWDGGGGFKGLGRIEDPVDFFPPLTEPSLEGAPLAVDRR